MPVSDHRAEITRLEARLREVEDERERLLRLLCELRNETESPPDASTTRSRASIAPRCEAPATPEAKVRLFRSLFRGRTDVYPRRWENARTQKSGYSPVCGNEWKRGVCEKPRVKCGDCPHREFVAVTDQVVLDHLRGRLVAGLYPLLTDETCHLLAIDFDGGSWREDVRAFASCRATG